MRHCLQTGLTILVVVTYSASGSLLGTWHQHPEAISTGEPVPMTIPIGGTSGGMPSPG